MKTTGIRQTIMAIAVAAATLAAPLAEATNGYFKIGYGSKNRGLAGMGMAYGQDSLAPAINPATLAGMGDRVDGGLELFNPQRESTVDATGLSVPDLGAGVALSGMDANTNSGATLFAIPNLGFAWNHGALTLGLAMVANGGMNTRYNDNLYFNAFAPVIGQSSNNTFPAPPSPPGPSGFAGLLETGFGVAPAQIDAAMAGLFGAPGLSSTLGVNLAQILITPTIAYKFNEHHSLGFSPIIGYQRFRAYGLGLFSGFSSNPGHLTNNGDDDAWGYGGRIGYLGHFGPVSIGASATSKIYMSKFNKYAGLFAEHGDFDIPATYGAGILLEVTPKVHFGVDVTRILYGNVASISNKGPTANEFLSAFAYALSNGTAPGTGISAPLGTNNGWGFGWKDVTVYKAGVDYAYNSQWTFRAGFNYAKAPYDGDQALFNVLAPAVVEKHMTVGFTYASSEDREFTLTYMHALRNNVGTDYNGSGPFTGFGYSARNAMQQNAIEASYAVKF